MNHICQSTLRYLDSIIKLRPFRYATYLIVFNCSMGIMTSKKRKNPMLLQFGKCSGNIETVISSTSCYMIVTTCAAKKIDSVCQTVFCHGYNWMGTRLVMIAVHLFIDLNKFLAIFMGLSLYQIQAFRVLHKCQEHTPNHVGAKCRIYVTSALQGLRRWVH